MANKSNLIKYVHEHLSHELRLVSANNDSSFETNLSLEEQTLIYKYSEDGYEGVNNSLRVSMGKTHTQLGKFLETTLLKLPDHRGLVYRNANLTATELDRYMHAFIKSAILVEHSFISTSISYGVANMFGGNCKFEIISKTGKAVERYTKYGLNSGQNEYEVVFNPNCGFTILEITKMADHSLIIMEEI